MRIGDDRERAPAEPTETRRAAALVRVEDVALALWVALGAPLLYHSGTGPLFAPAQPARGVMYVIAIFCAIACLAARRKREPNDYSLVANGAVGPLVAGMLLLAISAAAALDASGYLTLTLIGMAVVLVILVHFVVPPLPTIARRALIGPFVLASGSLFWDVIDSFLGPFGAESVTTLHSSVLGVLTFLGFSVLIYAMLIYAPRQVAEREGHLYSWAVRYALFAAAVLLGFGWQRVLTG